MQSAIHKPYRSCPGLVRMTSNLVDYTDKVRAANLVRITPSGLAAQDPDYPLRQARL